jgi:polyphenol oxidase
MEYEKRKLEWIEYDLLKDEPIISAKTFLRHGGVSEKNFFSLNVSNNVGDHPDSVKLNRKIIQDNINVSHLVFANQIHSDTVLEITKTNMNQNLSCDAIVTKERDIALVITHADCQAALFFDPENKVVAAAHAGWRGLCKNIYKNTINFMKMKFNSKPEDILVCISPSLCLKHSEFKNYKKEFPKELWSYQKEPFHFDLKEIATAQLLNEGIKKENIEISNECTNCDENSYFSYRRQKETGRLASVICLKK